MITLSKLPIELCKEVSETLQISSFSANDLKKKQQIDVIFSAAHQRYPHLKNIDDPKDVLSIFTYIWLIKRGVIFDLVNDKSRIKSVLKACMKIYTSPEKISEKIISNKKTINELVFLLNCSNAVFESKNEDIFFEDLILAIKHHEYYQLGEYITKLSEHLSVLNNEVLLHKVGLIAIEKGYEKAMELSSDFDALNHCNNILNHSNAPNMIDILLQSHCNLESHRSNFHESIIALDKATNILTHPNCMYILGQIFRRNKNEYGPDHTVSFIEALNKSTDLLNNMHLNQILSGVLKANLMQMDYTNANAMLQLNAAKNLFCHPESQYIIDNIEYIFSSSDALQLINSLNHASAILNSPECGFILRNLIDGTKKYNGGSWYRVVNALNDFPAIVNNHQVLNYIFAKIAEYGCEGTANFIIALGEPGKDIDTAIIDTILASLNGFSKFDIGKQSIFYTLYHCDNLCHHQKLNLIISSACKIISTRFQDRIFFDDSQRIVSSNELVMFFNSLNNAKNILANAMLLNFILKQVEKRGVHGVGECVLQLENASFQDDVMRSILTLIENHGFKDSNLFIQAVKNSHEILQSPLVWQDILTLANKVGFSLYKLIIAINDDLKNKTSVLKLFPDLMNFIITTAKSDANDISSLTRLIESLNDSVKLKSNVELLTKIVSVVNVSNLLHADSFIRSINKSEFIIANSELQSDILKMVEWNSFYNVTLMIDSIDQSKQIISSPHANELLHVILTSNQNKDIVKLAKFISDIDHLHNLVIDEQFIDRVKQAINIVQSDGYDAAIASLQCNKDVIDTDIKNSERTLSIDTDKKKSGRTLSSVIIDCRFFSNTVNKLPRLEQKNHTKHTSEKTLRS